MYKVSFTGYRPQKLPFKGENDPACTALKSRIYAEIERLCEHGAGEFYTGMAIGVDMWCAEAVLKLKTVHPEVRLTALLPCRGQDQRWSFEDQRRYNEILKLCDRVECLSQVYTRDCMFKRNRALVNSCDLLVAVYDGKPGGTKYTVDLAQQLGKKVIVIPPVEG